MPASALTGGVAVIGAILSSFLSDDCKKSAQESPLKQGCISAPTIRFGMFSYLFHLLLSPPSVLAPSTLPGSCSSHCCHQPGRDVVLGHSSLPRVKANVKLSYQVGKNIKKGLNKTPGQKQPQGRITSVVSISGLHLCIGEGWESDSVFFCPEILIYSPVLTAIVREVNTTGPTSLTDHTVYFMLWYSKRLSQETDTLLRKAGL